LDTRDFSMFLQYRKAILQSEHGVALLLTLILMVVFSLLSVSLFEMLKVSTQISGNHRLDLKATYVADTGLEDAINSLRDTPTLAEGQTDFLLFNNKPFGDGKYSVFITDGAPSNTAIFDEKDIRSIGTAIGFSRTVQAHVRIVMVGGSDPPIYTVVMTSWKLQ
jgi:hypothetical protein